MSLGMDPGLLREQLMLQESMPAGDGQGGRTRTWADVSPAVIAWAQVKRLATPTRFKAMQTDSQATHEVRIRSRTDVDTTNRWMWGTRPLVIVSQPQNLDEHGEFLTMLVKEERV